MGTVRGWLNRRDMVRAAFAMSVSSPIKSEAADSSGIRRVTLLRTSAAWDDARYRGYPEGIPELTVMRITVPARGELPWHVHPMPNAAYVVSGEITVEDQRGRRRHFSAGEVIPETVGSKHRGIVGDKPAVFIVFYAGVQNMPLSMEK